MFSITMGRYFLRFSYLGTHYRGTQKNIGNRIIQDTDSIQGSLEAALSTIIPKSTIRPHLILSSRTDAGVHALTSAAHVELNNKYNRIYNSDQAIKYINRYLIKCGHDIRLLDFIPVTNDFHARYSVKKRSYLYRFMIPKDSNIQKIPIIELGQCFHFRSKDFDVERVQQGLRLFMGLKDFTTFSAKTISNRPIRYVRELKSISLEKDEPLMPYDPLSNNYDFWAFKFEARSFLYNQVRRIVGALLCLGAGKITERDINIMLQVPSHNNWNPRVTPVPPHGLYLTNLEYDKDELNKCTIKTKPIAPGSFLEALPTDE